MSLFPDDNGENDLFMSRTDPDNPLGTHAPYSFELEGKVWPTVEHYFQGMKFTDDNRQEKVRNADAPALKEDDRHRARHLARAHEPLVACLGKHGQLHRRRGVLRPLELAQERREVLVGAVDVPPRFDALLAPLLLPRPQPRSPPRQGKKLATCTCR